MPVDVRRKGEDGFFGSLAIWAALFACKAPYHQDRVRKNADALLNGILNVGTCQVNNILRATFLKTRRAKLLNCSSVYNGGFQDPWN